MKEQDIQRRVKRMIDADSENQKMFAAIDKMWNMQWELPPELGELDWVRKEVSSDPHDAVRAGTRVLATVMPKVTLAPLVPNEQSREQADMIERALMWQFENSNRRGNSPMFDMIKHALLYDKIAVQVVYLPHQDKLFKTFNTPHKKRAAYRYGPYSFIVRDPKEVFIDYSDWMPERVVHRYSMSALELISFWGEEKTKKVISDLNKTEDDGATLFYTVYDYQDYDRRYIYACRQDSETIMAEPEYAHPYVISDEKMDLPFLPWVVRSGGKELTPMLYSIYKANQWESQNIFETIMSSEVIAYAASERGVLKSANPELVGTNYAEPGRDKIIRPGDEYTQLRPPEIDQNMMTMSDRLQTRISKSTVPNVIQTGDFPSGTAYATLNLATQSGVKAMAPYKRLAEDALGDVFTQMLYWVDYSGDTLESFPTNQQGQTEYIKVNKGDFDPDHIYLKVELTPDVPTDRMARINAAVMSNQNLSYSNRRALEDIGVTDPGAEIDIWYEEQTRMQDWQLEQQQKQQQLQLQMEAQQMQMQMQAQNAMQQQQMQMQQQMGQQQGQQTQMPGMQGQQFQNLARQTGRGFEPTRGSAGFNPGIGGTPPAMANPAGTRESQQATNITSQGGGF